MSHKTVFLVDSDIQDNPINNSIHLKELLSQVDDKQLVVKRMLFNPQNFTDIIALGINPNNILLLSHSFKIWGYSSLNTIAHSTNAPIIVYPSDFAPLPQMMQTFNHPRISKIILNSDYVLKYFSKYLHISNNKLKFLNLATSDKFLNSSKDKRFGRIVVTPSLISKDKDFITLLKAMRRLRYNKYINNMVYILLLKKHPHYTIEESNAILDEIHKFIESRNMTSYTRIVLVGNNDASYKEYLEIADVVLLPYDNSASFYCGTLIDAMTMGKPVVAPDALKYTLDVKDKFIDSHKGFKEQIDGKQAVRYLEIGKQRHCYDLVKQETGAFLYQNNDIDTIVTSCSIVFDNKDIKKIMEKQNNEIASEFTFSSVRPHLLNIIKKAK